MKKETKELAGMFGAALVVVVALALVASAALFFLLLAFPAARQSSIFTYDELCDYRMFIRPSMQCELPYRPRRWSIRATPATRRSHTAR